MVRLEPVRANPTLSQFFLSGPVLACKESCCWIGCSRKQRFNASLPDRRCSGVVLGAQGDCAGMVQQHCLGLHLPLLLLILLLT